MCLSLHSWANTGLIAVYQKLSAVRESKKSSSPNLQPRHWHCNLLHIHFPLHNLNYLEMLSSSSGGESEESCAVPVISTTKALTAGYTMSSLMSLRTSSQSQEIYADFQDYSLLTEHRSQAKLYQYTVVALLFKRLNSSPTFLDHPPDTSQEKKNYL